MARNITNEEIKQMNELYCKLGSYAAVSREVGRAASTVKKYIIPGYIPESQRVVKRFAEEDLPTTIYYERFSEIEDLSIFCILTAEEKEEMVELYKEVLV